MNVFIAFITLTLLTINTSSIFAGSEKIQGKVEKESIAYAQHLWFESDVLNEKTSMNIYLPPSFHNRSNEHNYPVIFINGYHGEKFFLTLSGIVKHLSELDRMPESIIVSLNYSGHFPKVFTNDMWDRETINGYGDTQLFKQHLEKELFPYLKTHYRANDYRIIIGISGSAIYPAYQLSSHPEMFDAYIFLAAADVFGMGFRKNKSIIEDIADRLSAKPTTRTQIYMAMADDDLSKAKHKPYRDNLSLLEKVLEPYKKINTRLKIDIIPNERHYAAFSKTILGAMEMFFPESKWAPKYRELIAQPGNALDNIQNYYQNLSTEYGFRILPKAIRWNSVNSLESIANRLNQDERLNEAIDVAEQRTDYQPNSEDAYHQWSEMLEANKQFKEALIAAEKSVELANKNKSRHLKNYQSRLEKLKKINQNSN